MTLTPHTISTKRTASSKKRLGRGNGSGKGTYSARGLKGQKARSGSKGKGALRLLAFKAQLQKVPKVRGFKSFQNKPETVTLSQLEKHADATHEITPFYLKKIGLIKHVEGGAKIVATGELKKSLTFKQCLATKEALKAIEKVGGKLVY